MSSMAEVKWIKLATDIFDNRKVKQIENLPDGDTIIIIWVKLLCLAGEINDSGMVYFTREIPYTDQMLSQQFNRPIATVQIALQTFVRFGMIELIDDILHISNWEKYQNIDGMEKIREQNRTRQARFKEKQKLISGNVTDNVTDNVTVTHGNAIDKNKNKNIYRGTFSPPTVDDVRAYCIERKNCVVPEAFVDYYTSNGWMVGKNHMKDWKAAVRTWERKDREREGTTPAPVKITF